MTLVESPVFDPDAASGGVSIRMSVGTSRSFQTVLCFRTGHPDRSPADWRAAIEAAASVARADPAWLGVRVSQSSSVLWIIGGTPAASIWLDDNVHHVVRGVVDAIGRAVPFEVRRPEMRVTRSARPVDYVVPRMIVAKSSPRWSRFNQPRLAPDAVQVVEQSIASSILEQAAAWGNPGLIDSVRVSLLDHGRPLPIMDAIPASRTANRRPVAALARADVRFTCLFELTGEWQFGMLGALGFGRAHRRLALSPMWTSSMREVLAADEEFAE